MEDKSMKELLSDINEKLDKEKKEKKFKIPLRGKISKSRQKKGWVTVLSLKDNQSADFEKTEIQDSTYKTKDGNIHSTDEKSIFFYKGKPLIIQPLNKLNPVNPTEGENETYGQKYVMARMLGDAIKLKRKVNGMLIFLLIIGGIAAYYFFSRGGGAA